MRTITCEDLARVLSTGTDIRLVCTLGARGFRTGHIPGSLSLATPEQTRAALQPDADIVVYGHNHHDPAPWEAAQFLAQHGHHHVRILTGGLAAWIEAGYQLDTPRLGHHHNHHPADRPDSRKEEAP